MGKAKQSTKHPAPEASLRIVSLRVQNYRALRDVHLADLTPLTALLGPNGSGKSTLFDVFNFLSECFAVGLRKAWDRRNRFRELRTRGCEGPIVFDLGYETPGEQVATYHLAIDEIEGSPVVVEETLSWRRVSKSQPGRPYKILSFTNGGGWVIPGPEPKSEDRKVKERLDAPDMLAVSTLGQLVKHPRVAALRRFISDWHVSYLSVDDARGVPEAGPQERLTKTGDNLANVIQYLEEQHASTLKQIFEELSARVPRLEKVSSEALRDGRLLLRLKDAPFAEPILAKFASDGTLKMLAYLVLLYAPNPPRFIGIEEPENFLHPRLLPLLAEECRAATERSQVLVTTHSPFFVNELGPEEVRALYRDEHGFTQVVRAADMKDIPQFIDAGAKLGDLWLEGYFDRSDPLNRGAATLDTSRRER